MHQEIAGSKFQAGESIYVFEGGEGKYLASLGYNKEWDADLYQVEMDDEREIVPTYNCFHINIDNSTIYRVWQMKEAKIKVTCKPITLSYLGKDLRVEYEKGVGELIKDGQVLHKDWEGNGIDFQMIIEKWLKRLNGHRIPLSKYYKDPINRFLDGLSF